MSLPTKYDICGNWKNQPRALRVGWWYPCYICDSITYRTVKFKSYTLWACKDCIPRRDMDNKEYIHSLMPQLFHK